MRLAIKNMQAEDASHQKDIEIEEGSLSEDTAILSFLFRPFAVEISRPSVHIRLGYLSDPFLLDTEIQTDPIYHVSWYMYYKMVSNAIYWI